MSSLDKVSRDVIELNIGGMLVMSKRSTLCLCEGSLLASMFSGRWEESLTRDEAGRVFLDYEPKLFLVVLNHLRHISHSRARFDPSVIPPPTKEFWDLVEYLGLTKAFPVCQHEEVVAGASVLCYDCRVPMKFSAGITCYTHVHCSTCNDRDSSTKCDVKNDETKSFMCIGGCNRIVTLGDWQSPRVYGEFVCKGCHEKVCPMTEVRWSV